MTARKIDHFSFLVADLDTAVARWSEATGFSFGPICRYRVNKYLDSAQDEPHFHDCRFTFSVEGPPHIELMEFTGTGSHGPAEREGIHHLGFDDYPDIETRLAQVTAAGGRVDGQAFNDDGELLHWFTDRDYLNGVRVEYCRGGLHPLIADDGSALPIGPDGLPNWR